MADRGGGGRIFSLPPLRHFSFSLRGRVCKSPHDGQSVDLHDTHKKRSNMQNSNFDMGTVGFIYSTTVSPPIIIQQQKYQMQVNRNRLVRWEREGKWGLGRLEWAPSLPQAANGVINGTRFEKKSGFTWKEEKFRLALCSNTVVLYNRGKRRTPTTWSKLLQRNKRNWSREQPGCVLSGRKDN